MSKLLASGGFGCVFKPAFTCNDKLLNEKYITKLQKESFSSSNEVYISYLIKKYKKYKDFFIPVIKSCKLDIKKINKTDVKECNLIRNIDIKYVLLKLEYLESDKLSSIKDSIINNKKLYIFLFNSFIYLLKGLKVLKHLNIIHFDLKSDNILFDRNTKYPKIIDFGISIPLDNLNNNLNKYFYVYSVDYYIWPLEVHFINYLIHVDQNITEDTIFNITNTYYNSNLFNKILKKKLKEYLIEESINFYYHYVNKTSEYIINDLIKYKFTWDNYALSIMYLSIFNDNAIELYNLLITNIYSNPNKRYDLDETEIEINKIIRNMSLTSSYNILTKDTYNMYENTIKKVENKLIKSRKSIINDFNY